MALQSKGGAKDIFSNITGILEETFPDVDITDIPGFKPGENTPETRTNFAVFMCSLIFGMFWITHITFFKSVMSRSDRYYSQYCLEKSCYEMSVMYMTPDFTLCIQDLPTYLQFMKI